MEFPRSNLGPGDPWARSLDAYEDLTRRRLEMQTGFTRGDGRAQVASLQDLAKLSRDIQDLADRVEESTKALPAPIVRYLTGDVAWVGTSWIDLALGYVTMPPGKDRMYLTGKGVAHLRQNASPPVTAENFIWPFPLSSVSSEFGPRPPLPYHNGIDFAQSTGTPIPASGAGTVILKGYYNDWGNYLRIDNSQLTGIPGTWTGYAHMNTPAYVNLGDTVSQGQIIGPVGNTGFSFGAHLHFETATNNVRGNPRAFMDAFGGSTTPGAPAQPLQSRVRIGTATGPAGEATWPLHTGTRMDLLGTTINAEPGTQIPVSIQVRSTGSSVEVNPATSYARLLVEGFAV